MHNKICVDRIGVRVLHVLVQVFFDCSRIKGGVQDLYAQSLSIMYMPALLHNSYFAIILCGLITISHATIDKQSQDTIVNGQRTAGGSNGGGGGTSNSYTSSQHPRPQAAPQHQQQQYAYHQQQARAQQTSVPQPPSPSHGGSGAHSDSIPTRQNSFTRLKQAMSEAVNHEFSK